MPFKSGNDLWKRREYVPGRSWNGKDITYEVDGNGLCLLLYGYIQS